MQMQARGTSLRRAMEMKKLRYIHIAPGTYTSAPCDITQNADCLYCRQIFICKQVEYNVMREVF